MLRLELPIAAVVEMRGRFTAALLEMLPAAMVSAGPERPQVTQENIA